MIHDEFTTGAENYKEFFYALVGLAGEGQNFDGNGMYVRFQTGGGSQTVSLGSDERRAPASCSATTSQVPLGNRPAYPGKRPPYKPDVPCYKQKLPDLNGPGRGEVAADRRAARPRAGQAERDKLRREADLRPCARKLHPFGAEARGGEGQVRTAIRKHLPRLPGDHRPADRRGRGRRRVILANQRLALPAWVPLVGKDFFEIEAEMSTAQAVTPGQGQTVNIAGVEVGEITSRQARGRQGDHRHADRAASTTAIYKDATVLLRPKTGLKDMVAELTPGHRGRRASCRRAA